MTRRRYDSGAGQRGRDRRGPGLGRAFALDLARRGWRVGVVDIDGDRAAGVAAEIEQHAATALPFACDISDSDQVAALARGAAQRLGPVVGLVNTAAIFSALEMGPFEGKYSEVL